MRERKLGRASENYPNCTPNLGLSLASRQYTNTLCVGSRLRTILPMFGGERNLISLKWIWMQTELQRMLINGGKLSTRRPVLSR